jgi:hypothetical protein
VLWILILNKTKTFGERLRFDSSVEKAEMFWKFEIILLKEYNNLITIEILQNLSALC